MWPLWLIILVAVAGAAVLTITGVLLAIHLERLRHRQILQSHGLTRGLSRYHRPKLSANEQNYSHVTHPTTHLRRSVQMPYGIVSVGHGGNVGEDEEQRLDVRREPVDDYTDVLRPKSNKSIRRSFSGLPLYIPKTRRPGKLRKSVPLERIQKSPLSAITEFSDPPTSAPPDVSEFPAHSSTIPRPENTAARPKKHASTQWPLAIPGTQGSEASPTEVLEFAARQSVLIRKEGGSRNANANSQSASVPRSVGVVNVGSFAPEEPLPPLPKLDAHKATAASGLRTRASNASLDTVGSSVLGAYSPANNGQDSNTSTIALNRRSPAFNLSLKQEFATPKLQAPPVKKTIHGLVTGKSVRSLHPDVDMYDSSPVRNVHHPELPTIIVREESFKTIDASKWALPPLQVKKIRAQAGQPDRHSMVEESKLAQWRTVSDSGTGLLTGDDVFAVGEALKRPNSVATGNPLRWDHPGSLLTKRHSLTSLDGHKRGHKRQNCIRISNLPILDVKPSSVLRMPELREEQHQPNLAVGAAEISDDAFEIKQPWPMFRARPPVMNYQSTPTPSPFKNVPILTPTARPTRKQYIQPPTNLASGIRKPGGTPRPDSEVFNSNHMDMPVSDHYSNSPRQWLISPTSRIGQHLIGTPPSALPSERTPFESPMLPSPALNSAALYSRKSLVKGPRSPRNQSQSSRGVSTSPLHNRHRHSYRVTKERDSSSPEALRKSVMMMRSMNSEGRLLDQQSSNIYRSVGDNKSPEMLAMPSPPPNKRIMGLRISSSASSMTGNSSASSPSLEKQQTVLSRGPSPLATTSAFNANKPDRTPTAAGKQSSTSALHVPASHLSLSSSIMSASGASIWEDASIRGESPEPEVHMTPSALRNRENPPSRSSSLHYRQQHQQQQQQYMFPIARDFAADVDAENAHASHLVQQLERVASSGQFDPKNMSGATSAQTKMDPVTPRTRREMDVFGQPTPSDRKREREVGLGLRLNDLIVGKTYNIYR